MCVNVSIATSTKDDVAAKCLELGTNVVPLITNSASMLFQLKVGDSNFDNTISLILFWSTYVFLIVVTILFQSYLRHIVSDGVDVWTDFVGGGSSATDYTNGVSVSVSDLKVQDFFMQGASYAEACVVMKGSQNYSLNGEACSTEAKFVCTKKRNVPINILNTIKTT